MSEPQEIKIDYDVVEDLEGELGEVILYLQSTVDKYPDAKLSLHPGWDDRELRLSYTRMENEEEVADREENEGHFRDQEVRREAVEFETYLKLKEKYENE